MILYSFTTPIYNPRFSSDFDFGKFFVTKRLFLWNDSYLNNVSVLFNTYIDKNLHRCYIALTFARDTTQESRLTQRETNRYIARCASVLAWCYLAGRFGTDTIQLTEKERLIGASQSEQMFEHISIISNNFHTFIWELYRVNIQDCRL